MDQWPKVSVSVVSHGQIGLVTDLLRDLAQYSAASVAEVLLTINIPETLPKVWTEYPFALRLIQNSDPHGFAFNHNNAAAKAKGSFFCILNPDVRFHQDVFGGLMSALEQDHSLGLVAPTVVNAAGEIEDSVRYFPTPWEMMGKLFLSRRSRRFAAGPGNIAYPDWVAGMFMLMRMTDYRAMQGLDEKFFLYYEDVNLCARMWLSGRRVGWLVNLSVEHDARRDSHRQFRYLWWHLSSMLRFFTSAVFWKAIIFKRSQS